MTLKDKFSVVENELMIEVKEYIRLSDELDTHKDKKNKIDHNLEVVNKLIYDLQKQYDKISPIIGDIIYHSSILKKLSKKHDKFLQDISRQIVIQLMNDVYQQ